MSESIIDGNRRTETPPVLLPALAAAALAAGLSAWGTYGDHAPDTGEYLIVLGMIAVAAAVVFGWAVPRALRGEAPGAAALVLSVLGVLSIAVFWSGLPPVLATGGIVLGWAGRNAPRHAGFARAAVAVGLLALAANVAVFIQDRL